MFLEVWQQVWRHEAPPVMFFVATFKHMTPPVLYICLEGLAPSTHPPKNEPVPQVIETGCKPVLLKVLKAILCYRGRVRKFQNLRDVIYDRSLIYGRDPGEFP